MLLPGMPPLARIVWALASWVVLGHYLTDIVDFGL